MMDVIKDREVWRLNSLSKKRARKKEEESHYVHQRTVKKNDPKNGHHLRRQIISCLFSRLETNARKKRKEH